MIEKPQETIQEKIKKVVNQFGLESIDGYIDLRERSNEDVMKFLYSLKESGIVLFHGTNAEERFDTLQARQANDSAKESGNKKAVYADAGITAPIGLAVLNKTYLKTRFNRFVIGWGGDDDGKMIFKLSPNVFELFKYKDPNIFNDGYIYVLNKSNFINAEDAGAEWHSEIDQKPIISLRIPKKLAENIFTTDTVSEYTPEEIKEIDEFSTDKKQDAS